MMTGVFSILKGCVGVEEQAIARALHFLRGGSRPGLGARDSDRDRDGDGFSTELEEERQQWQVHREASMAVLVQRAMSAAPPGQGAGEVRAAAERGRGGSGGKKSAYRSRRLQVRRRRNFVCCVWFCCVRGRRQLRKLFVLFLLFLLSVQSRLVCFSKRGSRLH